MGRGLRAVVLAAGEGRRMRSDVPKPLQPVGGRPMICRVLDALEGLDTAEEASLPVVVVVGHGAEEVRKVATTLAPPGLEIRFAEQADRRGTGDALTVAMAGQAELFANSDVIVLPADTPLLRSVTLDSLVRAHRESGGAATVAVTRLADPTGYGRVVRDARGDVARIVEQRDATPAEAAIEEVNTSIYCFRSEVLGRALAELNPSNAQAELYLTDVVGVLVGGGHRVGSVLVADPTEVAGVNDPGQLAAAGARLRVRLEQTGGIT